MVLDLLVSALFKAGAASGALSMSPAAAAFAGGVCGTAASLIVAADNNRDSTELTTLPTTNYCQRETSIDFERANRAYEIQQRESVESFERANRAYEIQQRESVESFERANRAYEIQQRELQKALRLID